MKIKLQYNIKITDIAKKDIFDAVYYIKNTLKNEIASKNLLNDVNDKISNLKYMPEKNSFINDGDFSDIRFCLVRNYIIFYKISKNDVIISRFLYKRSNWIDILNIDDNF